MKLARVGLALVLATGFAGVGRVGYAEDKKEEAPAARDAIDFRKLKEVMPAELGGIKRTAIEGEKNKIGEMSISHAKATYRKGDDDGKAPKIEIEVMDYGGVAGAQMGAASAMWANLDIDKESDDGYEKTTKVGEGKHPAFEKYEKENKHGQMSIWVGKRYILTVSTDNLTAAEMVKVANELPLGKLADLK